MKNPRSTEPMPLFSTAERNASRRNVVAMNKKAANAIKKRGGSSLLLSYGPPNIQAYAVSRRTTAKSTDTASSQQQRGGVPKRTAPASVRETPPANGRQNSVDAPAVAVAMVIHYARMAMVQRSPIPSTVLQLLAWHLAKGDPACKVVANWLERCGLARVSTLPLTDKKAGQ